MDPILTMDDYKKAYFRHRKCDHGHAVFIDGEEKEFGFIFPTFRELKGKSLFQYMEGYVANYFGTKKRLKRIYISR